MTEQQRRILVLAQEDEVRGETKVKDVHGMERRSIVEERVDHLIHESLFGNDGRILVEQRCQKLPVCRKGFAVLQPVLLFENVKGLLRPSFAEYFGYIKLRLTFPDEVRQEGEEWEVHAKRLAKIDFNTYTKTKYVVFHRLLNAVDYGVPQKRERVIIVGLRSDLKTQFVFPEKSKAPPKTIRSVIGNLPQPSKNPDKRYFDHIDRGLAKSYAGHTGSPIDEPSKTIKAGAHGVPGGENTILYPDGTLRYMTVREAKLIQTFPPDYKILGNWGEAMRQIGNAVPVKLATLLGKSLMDALS